jgi:hypothetical protein
LHLLLYPVTLGSGKRLLPNGLHRGIHPDIDDALSKRCRRPALCSSVVRTHMAGARLIGRCCNYCGGRRQTEGSSFQTPRHRRHSHQSPAEPIPRLRTSVLPQRTHDTGRCGSVARRPPRILFRRSGIAGLRRSISGHVWLTHRIYPEEDARIDLGMALTCVCVKVAKIWIVVGRRPVPQSGPGV